MHDIDEEFKNVKAIVLREFLAKMQQNALDLGANYVSFTADGIDFLEGWVINISVSKPGITDENYPD